MSKPYIIVTLGPTGSGKTKLVEEVIKYLNLEPDYKKFIVDDLIENNESYKQKVLSIIRNVDLKCKREGKHCEDINCNSCNTRPYYLNPEHELLTDFNKAYFDTKASKYCVPGIPLNCNQIIDNRLAETISKRENIIIEATGFYVPNWIISGIPFLHDNISELSYISNENPYNVIFAYSTVPFVELIKRNLNRTITSIESFTNDNTLSAPRLPDISIKNFVKKIKLIIKTLLSIYRNCIKATNEEICGTQRIDNLLIFDNSGINMKLVFDSNINKMTESRFRDLLNELFKLQHPVKAGNKKSRKKLFNSKQKRKISKKYRMD